MKNARYPTIELSGNTIVVDTEKTAKFGEHYLFRGYIQLCNIEGEEDDCKYYKCPPVLAQTAGKGEPGYIEGVAQIAKEDMPGWERYYVQQGYQTEYKIASKISPYLYEAAFYDPKKAHEYCSYLNRKSGVDVEHTLRPVISWINDAMHEVLPYNESIYDNGKLAKSILEIYAKGLAEGAGGWTDEDMIGFANYINLLTHKYGKWHGERGEEYTTTELLEMYRASLNVWNPYKPDGTLNVVDGWLKPVK